MSGVEAPPSLPPASNSRSAETSAVAIVAESRGKEMELESHHDAHRMCSDPSASQDFIGGIMKIVPSDLDVSVLMIYAPISTHRINKLRWGGGGG